MKIHRFIGEFDLSQNWLSLTDPELVQQIGKVLKLKIGEKIILGDSMGNEAITQIIDLCNRNIEVTILERYKNKNKPRKLVSLYCAILKKNFELVVQKTTEVGITEIIPVITEHTIKTGLNLERLRKIAKEAAEQSGRGFVPVIHEPVEFKNVIKENSLNIIFDKTGVDFKNLKFKIENYKNSLRIFVGPEGGWCEKEIELAKENNFQIASLGKLTLRAETATIIASYLTIHI